MLKQYILGANGDEYLVYTDSLLKQYTFCQQMGDTNGPITSFFSLWSNGNYVTCKFMSTIADTNNLVDKLWRFDTDYVRNETDCITEINQTKVATLREWLLPRPAANIVR